MLNLESCSVTVVIPTYNRVDQLIEALEKISACQPRPSEIIVHIDGDDAVTEPAIAHLPNIKIIRSPSQVGPGGGRNRAIAEAKHEIVASFDDDSYPIDADYFGRLLQLFDRFPDAAVIGAAIYHRNEAIAADEPVAQWTADFVGCGCAYRKSVFLQTTGYVQLPVAYDMEEVDLSLRLHDLRWRILRSSWLRVFHDTILDHHLHPKITAASISNRALLAYLRYPSKYWGFALAQCLNRIIWLVRHGRWAGIVQGIFAIPRLLQQYQQDRHPVSSQTLRSYLQLRQAPVDEWFALDLLSHTSHLLNS
ncbi:glycosyltransferase [Leptolyngbya sp. FACHB-17]|uniref:glycosyltransferase n=1 Tax=unclassified Leptolyngbya TaxID=2650499 RepID=UPI001681322C|nr:glycosyltransferase family 2 protein [Leptolyngbya sp. FACHB-17]